MSRRRVFLALSAAFLFVPGGCTKSTDPGTQVAADTTFGRPGVYVVTTYGVWRSDGPWKWAAITEDSVQLDPPSYLYIRVKP